MSISIIRRQLRDPTMTLIALESTWQLQGNAAIWLPALEIIVVLLLSLVVLNGVSVVSLGLSKEKESEQASERRNYQVVCELNSRQQFDRVTYLRSSTYEGRRRYLSHARALAQTSGRARVLTHVKLMRARARSRSCR